MRMLGIMLLLLAALTVAVPGQPAARPAREPSSVRGPGVGSRIGPVPKQLLILKPVVVSELELSQAQQARIDVLLKQFQEQGGALRAQIRNNRDLDAPVNPLDLANEGNAYIAARREQERTTDLAIEATLDPKQRARFNEMHLQAEGPAAFERSELCERLNLAPEQVELIRQEVREGRRASADIIMGVRPSREAKKREVQDPATSRLNALVALRETVSRNVAKVLTQAQRTRYRSMLGKPFDYARGEGSGDAPGSRGQADEPRER